MNANDSSDFTLFLDRNLDRAVFPPRRPARFSAEPEGEGMEVCLRGLLVVCLFGGMMICGAHLGTVARSTDHLPASPDAHPAVAIVQPATTTVAKTL